MGWLSQPPPSGPAEILDHGRTGVLFPPRDAEALAHAVLRLVDNPELCLRIGAAAHREVREKWLWSRIIEKMRRVYQELMPAACGAAISRQTATLRALANAA
jgi:glycosyltransferase involved in cell wall biosynthesis